MKKHKNTEFDFSEYYKSLSIREMIETYNSMIELGISENHIEHDFMKIYRHKLRKEKLKKLCLK